MVMIKTSATWRANPNAQKQGEFQILESAAGDVLTFRNTGGYGGVLYDDYPTADTAQAVKITPMVNVTIDGIKLLGVEGDTSSAGEDLIGIYITYGRNCRVVNCRFDKITHTSIYLNSCYACAAEDNYVIDSNMAGLGYGVGLYYACQGCSVINNRFEMCRHGVTIGGGSGTGVPRTITVIGNHAIDCYSSAYNCHEIGESINFSNNNILGGYSGIESLAYNGIVANNIIHGSYYGITTAATHGDGILYIGNYLSGCYEFGFYNEAVNTRYDIMTNNYILRTVDGQAVYWLTASNTHWTGNTIYACAGTPVFGTSIIDSDIVPFIKEVGTAAWVSTTYNGIDVDGANEGALAFASIPHGKTLLKMRVWGIAQADPGASNAMQLTVNAEGSKINEAYNSEPITITKNNTIDDQSVGTRICWELTASDDGDLDDIGADEGIQIKALYAAASGSDIATDVCLQYVELFYA